MRLLSISLLTVLTLLLGVTSATAFELTMSARNATTGLNPGDTVTVDVFLDADLVGIKFFSLAVLFDPTFLTYESVTSAALPVVYPAPVGAGTTGAEPSYILYSPGTGGMPAIPAVFLYPQQTPAWLTWPAPPAGRNQVNINYVEQNIIDTFDTRTTGNDIWIASLVLRVNVAAPNGGSMVTLCNTCGGNIFQIGDDVLPPGTIPLTGNFTVSVPEPAPMLLSMAAIASLALYAVRVRNRRS